MPTGGGGSPAGPGVVAGVSGGLARGGRRRRNALDGARLLRVVIKLTPPEKAVVAGMAAAQGITPPALFMRALLTGGTEAAAKYQRLRDELTAARRLLAQVSNNVNQLARQANALALDSSVPPVPAGQLAAALQATERAARRIEAIAGAASAPDLRDPRATPVGDDVDQADGEQVQVDGLHRSAGGA